MRIIAAATVMAVIGLAAPALVRAQEPAKATLSVPRLITVSGIHKPASGQPSPASTVITLAVYAEATGGAALFQETQDVALDPSGRYAVQLGATLPDGLPLGLFAEGQERWLGVQFAGPGEAEGARTRLTSVPYALRAADAETLGGHPASAYVLSPRASGGDATTASGSASGSGTPTTSTAADVQVGTPGTLAKYVDTVNVGSSAVVETGGMVGVGTAAPLDFLHVKFTNTNGGLTGYAVQNLGNTTTSYSGMLFYDQNGALGQFQGFNNVTHDYRINNIAKTAGVTNGSINFMLGGTSRFLVASNGNIGINTTTPNALLDVSNATSAAPFANVLSTSYTGSTPSGSLFVGRKARGTAAAPTGVLSGDVLVGYLAQGYGATAFSATRGGMFVQAAENWTDTAQGTRVFFNTTAAGTTTPGTKMTIDPAGNVGIGTFGPTAPLEVSRTGSTAAVVSTLYTNGQDAGSFLVAQTARGTAGAPAAVQTGDVLGALLFTGYATTDFQEAAAVGAIAAENFTDAARGTAIGLAATPLGGIDSVIGIALLPSGNVSIGTPVDANGIPTATDKLQVFGDIRVGTSGSNGCVKNFAGTQLTGTCVSDRRYKKSITPFGPVLNRVSALQPVHFYWRADEFPEQHFGDSQAYGLIAQDVEQVLPELVVTHEDGYKAVDYSKLPLLTIQAVKELKAENDDLKKQIGEIGELKQRISDLERVIKEMQQRLALQR